MFVFSRREFAESESLKVRQCHDSDRHQIQELSRKVKEEVSLSRGLEVGMLVYATYYVTYGCMVMCMLSWYNVLCY